jgi:hypothetical protein
MTRTANDFLKVAVAVTYAYNEVRFGENFQVLFARKRDGSVLRLFVRAEDDGGVRICEFEEIAFARGEPGDIERTIRERGMEEPPTGFDAWRTARIAEWRTLRGVISGPTSRRELIDFERWLTGRVEVLRLARLRGA